jgi:hypothetical protein
MSKNVTIRYTAHAEVAIRERKLEKAWIERTVWAPDWSETDPSNQEVQRRFKLVPERDDRILRVVLVENSNEVRILSAFFDRRARKPT